MEWDHIFSFEIWEIDSNKEFEHKSLLTFYANMM